MAVCCREADDLSVAALPRFAAWGKPEQIKSRILSRDPNVGPESQLALAASVRFKLCGLGEVCARNRW